MQIDTEHLHHWINAIRLSNNPMRTMDAFWKGQIKSKEWLISNLDVLPSKELYVEIHGGWVGVLASMLFQSKLHITNIVSIDIDPSCKEIAEEMNRIELDEGRFRAETSDMCGRTSLSNLVINTSCEHITQEQYNQWLSNMQDDQILVLQSNNYSIDEHIRTASSLEDFIQQSNLSNILFQGTLTLPMYDRYMIIGTK